MVLGGGGGWRPNVPGVEVHEEPFMQVHVEAVHLVEPAGARALTVLLADERGAGVRRVDVHPQTCMLPPHLGDALEVVYGARRRGPQRRGDVKRHQPLRLQLLHLAPQVRPGHDVRRLPARAHGAVPHAEDVGRLLGAAVALLTAQRDEATAQLHRAVLASQRHARVFLPRDVRRPESLLLECVAHASVARRYHGHHARLARAALDDAAAVARAEECVGQAEHARNPVQDDRLELRAGGRAEPVEGRGGEGGRVYFAEDGRVGDCGGEKGHEVWGLPVRQAGDDFGVNVGLDCGPWLRLLWGVRRELGSEVAGGDCWKDAARGEAAEVGDD